MNYFSPDYAAARTRFRSMAQHCGGRIETLLLKAKGPAGEDLSIDIAWFGSAKPRRAVLHSSGTHGVEGFAGSAIQLQLLDGMPVIPPDTALVVVHILNPYGMAWLRRVNEENVDLNRNFVEEGAHNGAPAAYAKLDHFLNPPSPPRRDLYLVKALSLIVRHGMPALKQAVAAGQWEFPKGLFFGGKRLQEGSRKYRQFVADRLIDAEQVVVIDVHTGLGKSAADTLLVESEDYERLRRVFGDRVRSLEAAGSPAYRIRGGLQSMFFDVFPGAEVSFLGQEFGTFGPIQVLHALREENRWHHYGGGTLEHPAKLRLKEVFCPESESWRAAVLKRGGELVRQAVVALQEPGR